MQDPDRVRSTDSHPPHADDAVIGRAFRRSLLALLVFALVVAVVLYLRREPAEEIVQTQTAPLSAPLRVTQDSAATWPPVRFTDVTAEAGITFTHVNGAYGERLLPETLGSGAAFVDYDRDGDQDLLLVNSDYWPGRRPDGAPQPTSALYRNDGQGHFEDVTEPAGLSFSLYGMGAAVADYDGDGWPDLYLTAVGENRLLRNLKGRFEDVTHDAGVGGEPTDWSTAAAFFDYDNDGDLDLCVAQYVGWSREIDLEVNFQLTGLGRAYGPPTAFEGTYLRLYRNEGNRRFADVSREAGILVDNPATGRPMAKALALAPVDLDRDGWIDLAVSNDTVQNFLFHNTGDGRFEEIGTLAGVAFDRNGAATGAMGMDAAHFRNDQDLGLAVGNFANEMTSLYVSQGGQMPLADEAIVEGIGPASRQALSFGLFFFDYDLDGRLDLLQANGHLESEINQVQPSQHYAQPPQLFWNCGPDCRASFVPVPEDALGDLAKPLVGRGATYADIDGDGDLDVLITQNGRSVRLFRNDQRLGHHWLRVRLVGHPPNRDAIGAWVELSAGGETQRRQVMPTRSFLSQVELPVTFGLGPVAQIERLEIRWPDGSTQSLTNVKPDTTLVVEEGQ